MRELCDLSGTGSDRRLVTVNVPCNEPASLWILLPGSGHYAPGDGSESDVLLESAAKLLAAHGFAAVRFPKSQEVKGYEDEYVLPAVSAWGTAQKYLPKHTSTFIFGFSLGGHLAPLIADAISEVAGIVIVNGHVRSLPDILEEQAARLKNLALWIPSKASMMGILDARYGQYLEAARRYDIVSHLDDPVRRYCCVHSLCDSLVPLSELTQWRSILPLVRSTFIEVPDADHGLQPLGSAVCPGTQVIPVAVAKKLMDWAQSAQR